MDNKFATFLMSVINRHDKNSVCKFMHFIKNHTQLLRIYATLSGYKHKSNYLQKTVKLT